SNSGVIRSTAHRMPPGAMSVTSSARAADGALRASATTVIDMTAFISVPRCQGDAYFASEFSCHRISEILARQKHFRAVLPACTCMSGKEYGRNPAVAGFETRGSRFRRTRTRNLEPESLLTRWQ